MVVDLWLLMRKWRWAVFPIPRKIDKTWKKWKTGGLGPWCRGGDRLQLKRTGTCESCLLACFCWSVGTWVCLMTSDRSPSRFSWRLIYTKVPVCINHDANQLPRYVQLWFMYLRRCKSTAQWFSLLNYLYRRPPMDKYPPRLPGSGPNPLK